jgi:pantothenate kinase type III
MPWRRDITFGAPAVVVDFGTAVTFDVVDARGNYVGGIIAPGLAAMTDYLHEKLRCCRGSRFAK